ncbi:MAG TPA: ABC transporter substrate-binding protein [Stellaceae bacterium]|jgi:phospholipid transport system substrate-binding protein|nr:ABC transporter substrate-binding protein [Stellaceae bacterium]
MRRLLSLGGLVLIAVIGASAPRPAAAQDAAAFVRTLGTEAIQVLGPTVPPAQRLARFRQLFHNDFDVAGIGQFVLGRYWRTATPQQQQEFLQLFQEYVVQAYASRLGPYGGEPFRVIGARPAGEEVVVSSEVTRPSGSPIQIDWYLIRAGGQLKITDVYVGGVSMKVTQRDEFSAIIQHDGGRIDGLLARLRQKTAAAQ